MILKRAALFLTLVVAMAAVIGYWWPTGGGADDTRNSAQPNTVVPPDAVVDAQPNKFQMPAPVDPADLSKRFEDYENASATEQIRLYDADPLIRRYVMMKSVGATVFEFYGRVMDQNDEAVVGATVRYTVSGGTYNTGSGPGVAVTDSAGFFDVEDLKGASLVVKSIEKEGYQVDLYPQERTFHAYARFEGEPVAGATSRADPFVFKAWKFADDGSTRRGGRSNSGWLNMVPDGRAYRVALVAGRRNGVRNVRDANARADLELRLSRSGERLNPETHAWRLELRALSGGIQPVIQIYSYEAPESGYQNTVELASNEARVGDSAKFWRHFFVESSDSNEYLRLSVNVQAYFDDEEGRVLFDYFRSSSRALDTFDGMSQ